MTHSNEATTLGNKIIEYQLSDAGKRVGRILAKEKLLITLINGNDASEKDGTCYGLDRFGYFAKWCPNVTDSQRGVITEPVNAFDFAEAWLNADNAPDADTSRSDYERIVETIEHQAEAMRRPAFRLTDHPVLLILITLLAIALGGLAMWMQSGS